MNNNRAHFCAYCNLFGFSTKLPEKTERTSDRWGFNAGMLPKWLLALSWTRVCLPGLCRRHVDRCQLPARKVGWLGGLMEQDNSRSKFRWRLCSLHRQPATVHLFLPVNRIDPCSLASSILVTYREPTSLLHPGSFHSNTLLTWMNTEATVGFL